MLTKTKIKFLHSLQQKKYRQLTNRFIVEGDKTVRELLSSSFETETIFAEPWWLNRYNSQIPRNVEVVEVSHEQLKAISAMPSPNGVLAVACIPEQTAITDCKGMLLLALDTINDPGNLGTIIRIADWFGVSTIVCSSECVDAFNPKVVSAAKGSLFRAKIQYTDLNEFFRKMNKPIVAATLSGENLYKVNFPEDAILLIGSEAHGISADLYPHITHQVTIPGSGMAESLNAAVASGIILAEWFRRKT
ncbi:MAG: RNA methyltransferase [Chitinophagales bacterium]|nr:RNA methyltransferase [Chitinophagales bacterium]